MENKTYDYKEAYEISMNKELKSKVGCKDVLTNGLTCGQFKLNDNGHWVCVKNCGRCTYGQR